MAINATPELKDLHAQAQVLNFFSTVLGFQASGIPLNYIIASAENPNLQDAIIEHSQNPRETDIDESFAKEDIQPDIAVFSKTDVAKTFFTFQAWKGIKALWEKVTFQVPNEAIDASISKTISSHLQQLGSRPTVESGADFEVSRQVMPTHRPPGKHLH